MKKDRYGTWIDFVKEHIPVRLDAKRCPVQESQLFMTTRALGSQVYPSHALYRRTMQSGNPPRTLPPVRFLLFSPASE